MPGVKFESMLTKLPVPEPSVVLLSAVVGPVAKLQQTPRAVTDEPPSEVISPPTLAVVDVIATAAIDVNTGVLAAGVVKVISFP